MASFSYLASAVLFFAAAAELFPHCFGLKGQHKEA